MTIILVTYAKNQYYQNMGIWNYISTTLAKVSQTLKGNITQINGSNRLLGK
jgi:hypothetical protein